MGLHSTLRWAAVGLVLVAVVGSGTLYAAAAATSDVPVSVAVGGVDHTETLDRAAIERRIAEGVDSERTRQDRAPLEADGDLRQLARYHSRQMHERDFVGHESPNGTNMTERYERFGLACPAKGENVHYERIRTAFGVSGVGLRKHLNATVVAREVVEGWLESSAHHENLLREEWNRQGVGVYLVDIGPYLEVYATQNFCGDSVSITVTSGGGRE
jgi:uncharacterized protein YkwD